MTTCAPIHVIPDAEVPDAATVFVETVIDGTIRRLLLDTGGAGSALVADSFTETLPSVPTNRPSGRGVFADGGATRRVRATTLHVGDLRMTDHLFDIEDNPLARSILGLDVLGSHRLDFWFDRGLLEFDGHTDVDDRRPLLLSPSGHPYVFARWGSVETEALWDSGADVTLVDENFARRHRHLFEHLGTADAGDARGAQRRVDIVRMAEIIVGERTFTPSTAAVTPLTGIEQPGHPQLDVILGMPVIRQCAWTLHLPERWWGYPMAPA